MHFFCFALLCWTDWLRTGGSEHCLKARASRLVWLVIFCLLIMSFFPFLIFLEFYGFLGAKCLATGVFGDTLSCVVKLFL